jgi:hypothetical protein
LQLLLIIDYIFDWARDVYRPTLISQLEALAKPTSEGDDEGKNRLVRIFTDSDVYSLSDRQTSDSGVWIDRTESPAEQSQDQRSTCETKVTDPGTDVTDKSAGSVPDTNLETINGSKPSVQNHCEHEIGQEVAHESPLLRSNTTSPTFPPPSEVGEDEAAEFEAAKIDSALTRVQELFAQDPSSPLPRQVADADLESALKLVLEQEDVTSNPCVEKNISNGSVEAVETGLFDNAKERSPAIDASASVPASPSLLPSTSPPSSIESTSSAPRARATAPSPSPVCEHRSSSGSPKRPQEPESDLEVWGARKRLRVCPKPSDGEVIVID